MNERAHDLLVEWTMEFVRNRDLISKSIKSIEKGKEGFDIYVRYKDKEQRFIVAPAIRDFDPMLQKIKEDTLLCIVTLNSVENLEMAIKNWENLARFRNLSVMFVNPTSALDRKWTVVPHTHNKICSKGSLETGLRSMFSTVEPISEKFS